MNPFWFVKEKWLKNKEVKYWEKQKDKEDGRHKPHKFILTNKKKKNRIIDIIKKALE